MGMTLDSSSKARSIAGEIRNSPRASRYVGAGTKPDRDGSKPDWETEQNRILAIGWRNWLVLMDL